MKRVRIALYVQAALVLACVFGLRHYADNHRHPTGFACHAYRLATLASLLLLVWVVVEVKVAKIQRWKCIVISILTLLMVSMTELATGGLVIGQ